MEEVSLMEIVKQLKNCCFWREWLSTFWNRNRITETKFTKVASDM